MSCGVIGCGGTDDLTAPANQAPMISISTNSSFGIAHLSTFALTATVTEPDSNPVSVSWTFSDGTAAAGVNVWRTFTNAGTIQVTATATDHLGASTVSNTVTLTAASPTGEWSGSGDFSGCEAGTKPLTATLVQSGAAVTGTLSLPEGFCTATALSGPVAQGEGTRVFGSGAVQLHVILPVGGVSFAGQIDTTGQQITGTISGIEPSGMPFTLTRQS